MAPPVGTIVINCTRAGVTVDMGPYTVTPPANSFTAYCRQFLIGKGWTVNSVTSG